MLYVAALLAVLASQTEGRLTVEGGLTARYQHVFDRNAAVDARVVGRDVVTLTPGGLLLRFSLPELELEDVVYPEAPIVCLGANGEGALLAGDETGQIYRVDVPTMSLTSVAHVPSRPLAIGAYRPSPGGSESIVVVAARENSWQREVHDLGTGRQWELDYLANQIVTYVDRSARLWIGSDNGEWGGWVARVDLRAGELKVYRDCLTPSEDRSREFSLNQFQCEGVYGFAELRNGSVWAHGGTTHLGASSAWIARLDDAGMVTLYENEDTLRGEVRRSEKPRAPITHIVEHPTKEQLYVVSYSELFRAPPKLERFRLAYKLDLRYRAGRPDAVGAYPSIASVEWIGRHHELLVSTRFDGLLRLSRGRQDQHAFAGELGATGIDRMERSNDGVFFFDDDVVWQRKAGDWSAKSFEPPTSPKFHLKELGAFGSWQTELAFVDAGGDIVAVSETNLSPGPRATVRWRADEPELLKIENDYQGYLESGFATPDGELWAASRRGLYRFSESGWVHAAALDMPDGVGAPRLHALSTARPPWFVLEQTSGRLFQLSYEGRRTRLRVVSDGGSRLYDAIPWKKRKGLFATSEGLRTYDLRNDDWARFDLALDQGAVRALTTDSMGRLWIGGAGLSVVARGRVVDLSGLPALRGVEVVDMIGDPHFVGGVIVSIGERGILYVEVE